MKIYMEIPDEEIKDAVRTLLIRRTVKRIEREAFDPNYSRSYYFRNDVKSSIRQMLKEHLDEVTERAVEAAANTIANKGIKKLLAQLQAEVEEK